MTYAWPSATTIYHGQCIEFTKQGRRCKRWRWTTSHEHPDGYRCPAHRREGDRR